MVKIISKKYIILIKKYHNCDGIKNNFERLTVCLFGEFDNKAGCRSRVAGVE
jgi:hypothetical protein